MDYCALQEHILNLQELYMDIKERAREHLSFTAADIWMLAKRHANGETRIEFLFS